MTAPDTNATGQWQQLVAALRDGMTERGHDVALLDAAEDTRLIRLPMGDGEYWEYPIPEHTLSHVNPRALANEILVSYRNSLSTRGPRDETP